MQSSRSLAMLGYIMPRDVTNLDLEDRERRSMVGLVIPFVENM